MNKKNIAILTIVILLITVIISYNLNKQSIEIQKELLNRANIILKYDNDEIMLNMDIIQQSEVESFDAIFDTSTTDAKLCNYTGVQIKNILQNNNINVKNINAIIITGVDGYSVAYSKDEILTDRNVFIAYMENGKYLDSRENGGRGPYESIIVSDTFSNRRCKWITKIEVK